MRKLLNIFISFVTFVSFISIDVSAAGGTSISNPNNTINASLNDTFYLVPSMIVTSSENLTGGTLVINNLPEDATISYTGVAGINVTEDNSKGVYTMSGSASAESYQTLFRSFTVTTGNLAQSNVTLSFTIHSGTGGATYFSDTGHYYEFVSANQINWHDANTAASNRVYNERTGYLATITSQAENDFIQAKLTGDGWFGASDSESEGHWKWVTGPEAGTEFWLDDTTAGDNAESFPGAAVNGEYENWNPGEPNNAYNSQGEDYIQMYISSATWNDLYHYNTGSIGGYIVEYGGLGTDNVSGDYEETVTLNISNQYSFKFLDYNGAILQSNLYDSGSDLSGLSAPVDPSREGYTFTGWDASIPATMPSNNVVINAEYSVNQYTLEFEDFDGTVLQTAEYDYAANLGSVTAPSEPTREGYTFTGWDVSIPATMPASNTTITAEYSINQYKVDFLDYDTSVIQTSNHDYNSSLLGVSEPSDPIREGYTFTGWDSEIPNTMGTEDVTINATYSINQYSLQFLDYDLSELSISNYDYGYDLTSIDIPAPTRLGYAFDGWDVSVPDSMPSENLTLTATYIEVPYTLTFVDHKGNVLQTSNHAFEQDLSSIVAPEPPSIIGYSFDRWSRQIPATMEDNDITISAIYVKDIYTLTFMDKRESTIESYSYTYGDSLEDVQYPSAPLLRGYTFREWDQDIPTNMPLENIVIKPLYDVNSYFVKFKNSYGNTVYLEEFNYGEKIVIDYPIAPEKTGYTFKEWVGSIPEYMGAADVIVEAAYDINLYEVTYEVAGEIIESELEYNSLLNTLPYRSIPGLSLVGWSYEGSLINVSTFNMPAKDIKLVAVYKDIAAPKFINLKDIYIEEGEDIVFDFSVSDNVDGDLTDKVSYSIDDLSALTTGVYTLTLSVEDSSGNASQKTIKVYVDFNAVQPVEIKLADNGKIIDQLEKDDYVEQNHHLNEDVIWFYEVEDDTHVVFDLLETEVYESLIVLYRPLDNKAYLVPTASAANWTRVVVGKGESREVVVPSSETYEFVTEYITVTGESITNTESTSNTSEDQMTFIIAHDNDTTILEIVDDVDAEPSNNMVPWYVGVGITAISFGIILIYVRKQSK